MPRAQVICLDDQQDESPLKNLKSLLLQHDFTVDEATSLQEFDLKSNKIQYDYLILDLKKTGTRGWRYSEALNYISGKKEQIKVIVLSAFIGECGIELQNRIDAECHGKFLKTDWMSAFNRIIALEKQKNPGQFDPINNPIITNDPNPTNSESDDSEIQNKQGLDSMKDKMRIDVKGIWDDLNSDYPGFITNLNSFREDFGGFRDYFKNQKVYIEAIINNSKEIANYQNSLLGEIRNAFDAQSSSLKNIAGLSEGIQLSNTTLQNINNTLALEIHSLKSTLKWATFFLALISAIFIPMLYTTHEAIDKALQNLERQTEEMVKQNQNRDNVNEKIIELIESFKMSPNKSAGK